MALEIKRIEESEQARLFLMNLGLDINSLEQPTNDPPDFWFNLNGRKIALELTEYNRETLRQREVAWYKLKAQIETSPHFNGFDFNFEFRSSVPTRRRDNKPFLKELVVFLDQLKTRGEFTERSHSDFCSFPLLEKYLESMVILRKAIHGSLTASNFDGDWIGTNSDKIIDIVHEKEEKLSRITKPKWLLITSQISMLAANIGDPTLALRTLNSPKILKIINASTFERIILCGDNAYIASDEGSPFKVIWPIISN